MSPSHGSPGGPSRARSSADDWSASLPARKAPEPATEAPTDDPIIEGVFTEEDAGDRALAIAGPILPDITEVVVTMGRTQNTGNFSNLRYDVTYGAKIPPGADREVVTAHLGKLAKAAVQSFIWADRDSYGDDWPASPR